MKMYYPDLEVPSETSSGDMEKAAKLMPAVDEEYARTIAAIKEL